MVIKFIGDECKQNSNLKVKLELTTEKEDDMHPILSRDTDSTISSIESASISRLSFNQASTNGGAEINGWMSSVRKNFCVFVLFDLLLVSLVWLILAMLENQGSFREIIKVEIFHYAIQSSNFDQVILAFGRFAVLQLFYGYLRFNSKFFVAFTTTATSVFLIAKIIFYNWSASNQTALEGMALLVSFILSWMEVWFLDWRVIPEEQFHRDANAMRSATIHQYNAARQQRVEGLISSRAETMRREANSSNFYTPLDSHQPSDDEDCENPEEAGWIRVADSAVRQINRLMEIQNWVVFERNDISQVSIATIQQLVYFKIELLVRAPLERVKYEVFDNIESIKTWNSSLEECSRVTTLGSEKYDILYQVTKKALGVSPRDMIVVRHCCKVKNIDALCSASIEHPSFPSRHEVVRAKVHPSGWTVRELPMNSGTCEIIGYMSVDLKLSMPKSITKVAFAKSLLNLAAGIHDLISDG